MSQRGLQNEMLKQAGLAQGAVAKPRYGTVTSYDRETYSVKVMLQPEGVETGFIKIETPWAGPGWGLAMGPTVGMQAKVNFVGGDINAGVVTGFVFSDADKPPAGEGSDVGPPAGEAWLVHEGGQKIQLLNDGTILVQAVGLIRLKAPLTQVEGDLKVSGDITDRTGLVPTDLPEDWEEGDEIPPDHQENASTLNDLRDAYNAHDHSGVTAGPDISGPTTIPVVEYTPPEEP